LGAGNIRDRLWYGEDGMEHLSTIQEPKQPIPTLAQTLDLLMKVRHESPPHPGRSLHLPNEQPENQHVKFNIDVKVYNDPDRLFSLMHKVICAQLDWETILAPRILLGLWHPRFVPSAKAYLPYCRRSYLGNSPFIARKYFWADVDAFSMHFHALATADGQKSVSMVFFECQMFIYASF
jgi:phosphatidylglycerol phospholipase C